MFSLCRSTAEQLGSGLELTHEHFERILTSDEAYLAIEKALSTPAVRWGRSDFLDEQLELILRIWGAENGLRLQLGIFYEGGESCVLAEDEGLFHFEPPRPLIFAGPSGHADACRQTRRTTVWVHNDNAKERRGSGYNHYSSVKLVDAADLPGQGLAEDSDGNSTHSGSDTLASSINRTVSPDSEELNHEKSKPQPKPESKANDRRPLLKPVGVARKLKEEEEELRED